MVLFWAFATLVTANEHPVLRVDAVSPRTYLAAAPSFDGSSSLFGGGADSVDCTSAFSAAVTEGAASAAAATDQITAPGFARPAFLFIAPLPQQAPFAAASTRAPWR